MASGKEHFQDSLLAIFAASTTAWFAIGTDQALSVFVGAAFAAFFTPDDDLPGVDTYPASLIRDYAGVLAPVSTTIRRTYQGWFRRHRGVSHLQADRCFEEEGSNDRENSC